ncbi:hypothetical protein Tco_0432054 [Tanacetum coccineum]
MADLSHHVECSVKCSVTPQMTDCRFGLTVSLRCEALDADIEIVRSTRTVMRPLFTIANRDAADRDAGPISRVCAVRLEQICLLLGVHRCETRNEVTEDVVDTINLRLFPSSEDNLIATGSLINHASTDGTVVPISIVFDRFRNMGMDAFQTREAKVSKPVSNSKMHCPTLIDVHDNIVGKTPSTVQNHAYLCLDVKHCIIRPAVHSRCNQLSAEYSDGHTKSVRNVEESSSSGNIIKRSTLSSSNVGRHTVLYGFRGLRSKNIVTADVYSGTVSNSKAPVAVGKPNTIYAVVYTRTKTRVKRHEQEQFNALFGSWMDPLGQPCN